MNRYDTFTTDDGEWEFQAEAEAGVSLSFSHGDGEVRQGGKWWGSRIRYRRPGGRRWTTVLAVDVHPFSLDDVETAFRAHAALKVAA